MTFAMTAQLILITLINYCFRSHDQMSYLTQSLVLKIVHARPLLISRQAKRERTQAVVSNPAHSQKGDGRNCNVRHYGMIVPQVTGALPALARIR
jgi:hypothetical protein